MKKFINTNIRFKLNREDDRKAYNYLLHMDRKQFKSYTRAVVAALNDFFSRQEKRQNDPFLETREKEDAFLQSVLGAVEKGAKEAMPMVILNTLICLLQSAAGNGQIAVNPQSFTPESDETSSKNNRQETSLDDALSFADSF